MSSEQEKCFAGQTAIVTGGADGLGRAIVSMLLQNGAKVTIFDVVEEKTKPLVEELKSAGHNARGCKVDVSQEASVKQGFVEFTEFSNRLDIMVNCAGIVGPNAVNSEAVSVEEFDRVCAGKASAYDNGQSLGISGQFWLLSGQITIIMCHHFRKSTVLAIIARMRHCVKIRLVSKFQLDILKGS